MDPEKVRDTSSFLNRRRRIKEMMGVASGHERCPAASRDLSASGTAATAAIGGPSVPVGRCQQLRRHGHVVTLGPQDGRPLESALGCDRFHASGGGNASHHEAPASAANWKTLAGGPS